MEYTKGNYENLLNDLFSRHPSVQNTGFGSNAYKPGLDGMRAFDSALGRPGEKIRAIHVAGTNGKGSVSSMLAAALSAEGLRVGLYTSPHLVDFRERIKIIEDGAFRMIPREYVFDFVNGSKLDGLSFFEITTGMAFRWFADEEVDIAVIETGLGGRLDSTNILTPELSIVTSIGLDHCALLGNTRSLIAAEKGGIFKPGVPALAWGRDPETAGVFEKIASDVHCPLFFAEDFETRDLALDLEGPYQADNLRTALAALEILGIDCPDEALCNAAAITGLRGRWEKVYDNPMVICDIGHNPPALEINFRKLKESGKRLLIVFGVMKDKDLAAIIPFMPVEARYFLVAPEGERAMKVEALAEALKDFDTCICGSVAAGVKAALALADDDCLIYIGGSNFVVAEALAAISSLTAGTSTRRI